MPTYTKLSCLVVALLLIAGCSEKQARREVDFSAAQFQNKIGKGKSDLSDRSQLSNLSDKARVLDPEQLRTALRQESVDDEWAAQAEETVLAIYDPVQSAKRVRVECRKSACEVSGTLDDLDATAIESVIDQIAGPEIDDRLGKVGLEVAGEPVYTVLRIDPLSLSFSRVLVRSPEG